ncbi:MAG: PEP-CTERM sorting domain-containing protein [Planctomycetota bacterium]
MFGSKKMMLAAVACGGFVSLPSISQAEIIFDDFSNGGSMFTENINPAISPAVDGVILTLTTVNGETFNTTGTGTGINGGASNSNIDPGENFFVSFNQAGSVTSFDIGVKSLGGGSLADTEFDVNLILSNPDTGESIIEVITTTGGGSAGEFDLAIDLDIAVGLNESLLVEFEIPDGSVVPDGGSPDYRIEAIGFTAIPEPGSMTLAMLGLGLLASRRRKA